MNRKFHLLFLGLSLLALISCASNKKLSKDEQNAMMYYNQGTTELIEKRYTEALGNLLKAHKLNPSDDNIVVNLAMAYYFKEQKKQAVLLLKKALDLNPKNTDAKVNLATIALNEGKLKTAQKLYLKILGDLTYTKQARTYYNLGLIELRIGNKIQAKEYFQSSINETNTYCPSHFELGKINLSSNDFDKALDNFKQASLGACYENPAPLYYQALTFIKQDKLIDARMKLAELISKFPANNQYTVLAREKSLEIKEITAKRETNTQRAGQSRAPAI